MVSADMGRKDYWESARSSLDTATSAETPSESRLSFVSEMTDADGRSTTTDTPQYALVANGLISHAMLKELLQNPRATSAFSFVSGDEGVTMEGVVSIAAASPSLGAPSKTTSPLPDAPS